MEQVQTMRSMAEQQAAWEQAQTRLSMAQYERLSLQSYQRRLSLLAQGPHDDTASYGLLELLAPPPRVFTRSSGEHDVNSGGAILADYNLEAARRFYYDLTGGQAHRAAHYLAGTRRTGGGAILANYDLEAARHFYYDFAGGQAHRAAHRLAAATVTVDGARRTDGGAAASVEEPSDVAKMLEGIMVQVFAACLPACVTVYPLLKDAPDHLKLTIFGGLVFTTVGLFVGLLSKSVARRGLAIRLVSVLAVAVLAFSVASQLSSRTYIAITALVGVALNFIIMMLRF